MYFIWLLMSFCLYSSFVLLPRFYTANAPRDAYERLRTQIMSSAMFFLVMGGFVTAGTTLRNTQALGKLKWPVDGSETVWGLGKYRRFYRSYCSF